MISRAMLSGLMFFVTHYSSLTLRSSQHCISACGVHVTHTVHVHQWDSY